MILTEEEVQALIDANDGKKILSVSFGPGYVKLNKSNKNKWAYLTVMKLRRKKTNDEPA